VPLLVVIVLVVLRLLLTPVVERFLRSGLQKMEGFSASFSGISLSLKDLKLIAHDFAMDRIPAADAQQPLLDVKTIEVDLLGKELLRGRMVAQARFIEPRLYLAMAAAKSDTGASPAPPPAPPDMTSGMKSAMPFRFDRIEIRKGEMTLVDTGEDGSPEIRLGEIEATIENIETGTQLGTKRPSVFAARAKLQNSGEITLFYTANLLSRALTFAGQARLKGLKLAEINPLIASKTGMKVEKGEFDVFTAFSASDGIISGGVKPFLKHVDFKPWKEDMVTRLKVGLTDLTFWVFSDRVPSREAVAGIVPFHGEITNPSAQILPTILSVVRNAFVLGLASGFAHLPPDKAALEGSLGAGKIGDKKD
jgi:hypothetical protein